jgi:ferric-dicitrate binding protein FerR (iron transport regulator)
MSTPIKIITWLKKYQSENISRAEFRELQKELKTYTNEELFPIIEKEWNDFESEKRLSPIESQQLFERIRQDIKSDATQKAVQVKINWTHIAASAVIFLLSSLSFFLYVDNKETALLEEREVILAAGKGERASIVLPDGTTVRLNSETTLSYKQDFGKKERRISLSGEGFFEVKKDSKKKFIVNTEFLDVEVTGTTFNVYAYENKEFLEIALIGGSIITSTVSPPFKTMSVLPNEKVIYNKMTGKMSKECSLNKLETAWLSNELVFRSESLGKVLKMVGRKYGVTFTSDNKIALNRTYTGVFDKEELVEIMAILKVHCNFDYRIKDHNIYIEFNK